jgi:hypothetical protein
MQSMAPKRWTSAEQQLFLESFLPQYLLAKTNKRLEPFWSTLDREWFGKYPERDLVLGTQAVESVLTDEEAGRLRQAVDARKKVCLHFNLVEFIADISETQQLKTWMRNTTQATTKASKNSGRSTFFSSAATTKRTRVNQRLEIYSKRYYDEKMKGAVDEEFEDEFGPEMSLGDAEGNKVDDDMGVAPDGDVTMTEADVASGEMGIQKTSRKRRKMEIRRRVIKESYEGETEEVKREVEEEYQRQFSARQIAKAAVEGEEGHGEKTVSAEEYQE